MICRVWVGCLHSYNCGDLCGEWVEMPTDAEEVEEVLERVIAPGGEECFIGDYEADLPGVVDALKECGEDFDKMAELVEEVNQAEQKHGEEMLAAAVEYFEDLGDALRSLESEEAIYMPGPTTDEDLGAYLVDNGYYEVPERSRSSDMGAEPRRQCLSAYIDYEKLGRSYRVGGAGSFTKEGYFESN